MFSSLKLGTKILLGYLSMAALLLMLAMYTYSSLVELARLQDEGASRYRDSEAVSMAAGGADALYALSADLILNRDIDGTSKAWDKEFKIQEEAFAKALKMADTEAEKTSIRRAQESLQSWNSLLQKQLVPALRVLRANDLPKEIADLDSEIDKIRTSIKAELMEVSVALSAEAEQDDKKFDETRAGMSRVLLMVSMISIGLALGLGYFLSRSISQAIARSVQVLRDISAQVGSASGQLSSAAQQLASGAAEQASSIEESTASLEEMGGMVSNNVDNAGRAADLSQSVANISERGNGSMAKMQESMREILESNEKIEQLVKVIAAIGERTKVMDEIVFQTKLLSFNASVEAERAGEHGRGFAVVAQEVGNLAQMSGKAAQEIAQILASSLKQAEAITVENRKKVEVGANLASETAAALREILQSANSMSGGANQVLEASKEQAAGIKQVNIAMSNLEKATQESAALAEEVASTAEELSAQTASLNASVLEMDRMVNGAASSGGVPMGGQATDFVPRSPLRTVGHGGLTSLHHEAPGGSGRVGTGSGREMGARRGKAKGTGTGGAAAKRIGTTPVASSGEEAASTGSDDAWEKL